MKLWDQSGRLTGHAMRCALGLLAVVVVAPAGTGCDDREATRVHEMASPEPSAVTTQPSAAPTTTAAPGTALPSTGAAGVSWSLPTGWRQMPGERTMRLATFETGGERVEVALSSFPGNTGGLLANVNRWRGQVGLPPIAEPDLAASLTPVATRTLRGHLLRLRGESQHMLGAILAPADGSTTYFLKAVGPPAALDAQESAFNAFAASLQLNVKAPSSAPAANER